MNIIILGCGKVGQTLAVSLEEEEEHNITVIDTRYSVVQNLINNYDIMGVAGNGMNADILKEAGVEDADIFIAVAGSDELNLMACLMAKKLGAKRTIARVRTPEYSKNLHLIKDELGLAMVINPERAAASEIARILRFPSAMEIDTFSKGRIEILKFIVPDNSCLDNLQVCEIVSKLNCDILVCGVERTDSTFIPDGSFVLKSGDAISIVGSIKNVTGFFKKIGIKTTSVKDTMIIGGGETAYYLASQLEQTGINVKIIEQKEERCEELCTLLPKATIINGDGTENRLLLEEGLENADSVVSLTNIDEENILLSLFAKSKSNAKIITKINRIAYDEVIGKLNLGTTVYPKNITAECIVRFVRAKQKSIGSNIETMHLILDEKAEALEFKINENSPVINKRIDSLNLKENTLIACIHHNGKVIIPRGRDIIQIGDTVIVVALKSRCKDINDILK